MQRQTIGYIWAGGVVLAILLYVIGPDRFIDACLNAADWLDTAFHDLLYTLGTRLSEVVRALAIALYVVFLVLAVLAAQRGLRAWGAVIVVTGLLLLLVWRPASPYPAPPGRWAAALVVTAIGAGAMTRRLLGPPPPPRSPPWPPFRPQP